MSKIVELRGENFKRLKVVTIRPDGNVVVLNGPNGSGKSSALDAIWGALGGKDASPEVPIRRGERKAVARVTLDSGLVVESTWTAAGGRKLKVTDANGAEVRSPQSILNELCRKHTIDPLRFASMKSVEQLGTLKNIVGLDFTELDTKRKALYDRRTEVNREANRLRAQLRSLPPYDTKAPKDEVSIQQLTTEWQALQEERSALAARTKRARDCVAENDRLQATIRELEAKLDAYRARLSERAQWIAEEETELKRLESEFEPRLEAASSRLDSIEATNASVRANREHEALGNQADAAERTAEQLTQEIETVDEEKARLLSEARFPVPGLGFAEDGVTYDGLPFSQASDAQRVRVSTAIGLALSPGLKVLLIRDAEKLDAGGMKLIADLAAEHDAQLWLERAGHNDPGAVVFEDGEAAYPAGAGR
jgi:DNA repair exonuclease SbcCD ATPase subunit